MSHYQGGWATHVPCVFLTSGQARLDRISALPETRARCTLGRGVGKEEKLQRRGCKERRRTHPFSKSTCRTTSSSGTSGWKMPLGCPGTAPWAVTSPRYSAQVQRRSSRTQGNCDSIVFLLEFVFPPPFVWGLLDFWSFSSPMLLARPPVSPVP